MKNKINPLTSDLCRLISVIRLSLSKPLPPQHRNSIVAVGNFDGCHLGHQHIFQVAQALAEGKKKVGVLTFEPHPREFFQPSTAGMRLTSLRTKLDRFAVNNIDVAYVAHFNQTLAALSPQAFIDQILIEIMGASHVVVGHDFAFGHKRQGNVQFLQEHAKTRLLDVSTIAPVLDDGGEVISSTRIRHLLQTGQIEEANNLLGWTWEVEGIVKRGEGRGRQLGWPTLNIDLGRVLHPLAGIYVAMIGISHKNTWTWYPGIAYSGNKPTFSGDKNSFEAHLFDRDQDLYHQRVRVKLLKFLRPDQFFDTKEGLIHQMQQDEKQARTFFEQGPYELNS